VEPASVDKKRIFPSSFRENISLFKIPGSGSTIRRYPRCPAGPGHPRECPGSIVDSVGNRRNRKRFCPSSPFPFYKRETRGHKPRAMGNHVSTTLRNIFLPRGVINQRYRTSPKSTYPECERRIGASPPKETSKYSSKRGKKELRIHYGFDEKPRTFEKYPRGYLSL